MDKLWCGFIKPLQGARLVWMEIMFITLISAASWVYFYPFPQGLKAHYFFWPLLGPLLVALRYGFAKGFICTMLMTIIFVFVAKDDGVLLSFPFSLVIGLFFMVMAAGEFRDHWQRRIDKCVLEHKRMQQKLADFTKNYHLLKVSHDQLELRHVGKPVSLRAEINSLQQLALQHSERRLIHIADPLLALLAHVGGLQVAGIYTVMNDDIELQPNALIGDKHKLVLDDPMLQDMLECKKLLSPITSHIPHRSRYQLCIPLVDSTGKLQAVVLAETVRFFSLTPANVVLLSLIADNAADLLSHDLLTPVLMEYQHDLFIRYIYRAHYNHREYAMDSCLIILDDSSGLHHNELHSLINYRRGGDVYWVCEPPNQPARLMVLLPLTSMADSLLYISRVKEVLFENLGERSNDIDILGPFSFDKEQGNIDELIKKWGPNDDNTTVSTGAFG